MKIMKEQRGMLFKKGDFCKLLMPGDHVVFSWQKIELANIYEQFNTSKPIELMLENKELADQLEIVEIKDKEICIFFENGLFKTLLKPGKHVFWKNGRKNEFIIIDLDDPYIDESIGRAIILKPSVKEFTCSYGIDATHKGILYIENKFVKILEPGNYFFWKGSKSINVLKVDLRQLQMEINGQEIMSKDKIPLRLNFFCQYRITDIMKAVVEIKDFEPQFYVLLQLALREYIGTMTLDEILEKKEEIGKYVTEKIRSQASTFGLEIIFSGIKDVILPGDIKEIINQVLIAEKKSQANVIMRREETASTRSLLNTAKLMEDNKILYKLKELEYIEKISEKISQITLTGGMQIIEQLKDIFLPQNKKGE
jgi:hypothetical protein